MKYKLKNILNSAVWAEDHVEIEISPEEANDLRQALKTIQKHKEVAIKAYKSHNGYSPERDHKDPSHWCEFDYCVKNDKIIVIIRNGMAG